MQHTTRPDTVKDTTEALVVNVSILRASTGVTAAVMLDCTINIPGTTPHRGPSEGIRSTRGRGAPTETVSQAG